MIFDFLNNFSLRMKKIGYYSLIFRSSSNKTNWRKYGFENHDEEENLIFSIFLYLMEQSLKEEFCTIDDISGFVDKINDLYYKKSLSYQEIKELVEFIINTILCNDGNVRYYKGFNYETSEFEEINISYVITQIVDINGVRRVSYSLTDEGYNMILSTFEIEENLKITIHELIFKKHLEKAKYSKAVDDIKNVFNLFRARVQKIEQDVQKIRENPLKYSNKDYEDITLGNLELIKESKDKFKIHRGLVQIRIDEFKSKEINIRELNKEETENLNNLKMIKKYLNKTIDEDQKILKKHNELKEIYAKELQDISKMTIIKRFNLNNEVYEKVLEDISNLKNMEMFLRPLFKNDVNKNYNINKAFQYQNPISKKILENESEKIEFEIENMENEKRDRMIKKLQKYKASIEVILECISRDKNIYLSKINSEIEKDGILKEKLIPTVEIFREVIIEFLNASEINIKELKDEKKNNIDLEDLEFQLNKTIISIIEENDRYRNINKISVKKALDKDDLNIKSVLNELGESKNFICADIYFGVE